MAYLAGEQAWIRWGMMASRNCTWRETDEESNFIPQQFAISLDGTPKDFIFATYPGNPWDLGTWANLGEVFGLWSAPLFWVQPETVKRYGKKDYPLRAGRCDLKMSDYL